MRSEVPERLVFGLSLVEVLTMLSWGAKPYFFLLGLDYLRFGDSAKECLISKYKRSTFPAYFASREKNGRQRLLPDHRDQVVTGWTSIRVAHGIERVLSDFDISLTERCPDELDRQVVGPGMSCEARLGDDLVITGWVDHSFRAFLRTTTRSASPAALAAPTWSTARPSGRAVRSAMPRCSAWRRSWPRSTRALPSRPTCPT